jgi:hypothetical protein
LTIWIHLSIKCPRVDVEKKVPYKPSFYEKYRSVIDGIIASALYSFLALLAGFLVRQFLALDTKSYLTVVWIICIQAALGFFVFVVARRLEKNRQQRKLISRTHQHHWFAHFARDLIVKACDQTPPRNRKPTESVVPQEHFHLMEKILMRVAKTFQLLVPARTKVFASIRERQTIDNRDEFVTILRASETLEHEERAPTSEPLPRNCPMVALLESSFNDREKRDCVLLTGSNEDHWQPLANNKRGQDLSVLLGAVFSKRLNREKEIVEPGGTHNYDPIELEWILCVAADTEGVFNDSHKNLMKCFNDIFGLLLNFFLRQQPSGGSFNALSSPPSSSTSPTTVGSSYSRPKGARRRNDRGL